MKELLASLTSAAAAALMVMSACGGVATEESSGGSGGAGAEGGSGAGGSGGVGGRSGSGGVAGVAGSSPTGGMGGAVACGGWGASGGTTALCRVDENPDPVASPVTFRFSNLGNNPVFLHESCSLEFKLTACTDGYTEPLTIYNGCTGDCSQSGGCVVCGACFDGPYAVPAGGTREHQWSGETFAFAARDGCACHCSHPASASSYRITVPVYESELAVQERRPAYSVSVDFELPVAGGVLVVPIQ